MTSAPEVTVVIPTCGRAGLLRGTLDALLRQELDLGQVEIIVVCDGPDPATAAVVTEVQRRAPCRVHFIEQSRQGPGIARNRGVDVARGRVVLMLDDDISAAPGLIAAHLRHHRESESVVVTGALRIEPVPDEPEHRRIVREWWDGEFRDMASSSHRATFRDFVTGNVSVARARLVEVGAFDPAFTGYGREDYELGLRLQKAGVRFVHEPAAFGIHHYEKPLLEWVRMFRTIGRADVIFARLHPDRTDEVMALTPFVRWPGIGALIPSLERLVLARSDRGGRAWLVAAAVTQGAHYWEGVDAEARDPEERARLIEARRRVRKALIAAERIQRGGWLWERIWRRVRTRAPREVARLVSRALGRTSVV